MSERFKVPCLAAPKNPTVGCLTHCSFYWRTFEEVMRQANSKRISPEEQVKAMRATAPDPARFPKKYKEDLMKACANAREGKVKLQ